MYSLEKKNCDRLFKKFDIEMIVVDSVNLSLLSFNADNEKKDTNSIREIVEFETERTKVRSFE